MRADLPFGPALRQPDQRSCGAACVVVARMLRSHPLRSRLVGGFSAEVLSAHRVLTSATDVAGRPQLPWPRALGTPPWAVARALAVSAAVPYRTALVRWSRGSAYDSAAAAVGEHPVALYVGSATLPRHVVLVLAAGVDGLDVYDPADGRLHTVTRRDFEQARLRLGGWPHPWFLVHPSPAGHA